MANKRDKVNFESQQRVDLGDIRATINNITKDMRRSFHLFLYGIGSDNKRHIAGFRVTASGTPDSFVTIDDGVATGAEKLNDDDIEYSVIYGADTVTERQLDFSALANGTYSVWLRYSADPGEPGVRVFYNPDTDGEEAQAVNTRIVHDWDVQISASSPGTEWQELAEVVWDGATIASGDITDKRHTFFEGNADTSWDDEWGDGANDRNSDRSRFGIHSLYDWVHGVRRQIQDIIGNPGSGAKWYLVPPIDLQAAYNRFNKITAFDAWIDELINADEINLSDKPQIDENVSAAQFISAVAPDSFDVLGNSVGSIYVVNNSDTDGVHSYVKVIDGAPASVGAPQAKRLVLRGRKDAAGESIATLSLRPFDKTTGNFGSTVASIDTSAVVLTGNFVVTSSVLTGALDTEANIYLLQLSIEPTGGGTTDNDRGIEIYSATVRYERTRLWTTNVP